MKEPQNTCPYCHVEFDGGMTLVRHMHDAHNIDFDLANMLVDLMYSVVAAVRFPESQNWSLDIRPDLPEAPDTKDFLAKFDQEMKHILSPE